MLLRALVLVTLGTLLGLAVNAARPGGVSLASFSAPAACEAGAAPPAELEPLQALARRGPGAIIADVRSAAAYAEGHVADAIHLPCDSAGQIAAGRIGGANTVVVYGNSTEDARPVAETLARRGLEVAVIKGGFAAWSAAGLACASGACDDCAVRSR